MKILLGLSATVLVALCATWAYQVNYATREAASRVSSLQFQVAREREALSVLRAEWAFLNRPDRLSALVALYQGELGLVPLTPEQFGEVAMVAYPPVLVPVAGDFE